MHTQCACVLAMAVWRGVCGGGGVNGQDHWMPIYLRLVQLLHAETVHAVKRPPWVALPLPGFESLICQFCHLGSFLLATLPCRCWLIVLSAAAGAHQHCADSSS